MATVGVREMRQNFNEILRGVEAGEPTTITLEGRPVARIVPIRAQQWATWDEIQGVFDSPSDASWSDELHGFGAPGLPDPSSP